MNNIKQRQVKTEKKTRRRRSRKEKKNIACFCVPESEIEQERVQ